MKTKTNKAISALESALAMTGDVSGQREDEFTCAEYADRLNSHTESARRILNKMVKEGKLMLRKNNKGHFYSLPS